MTTESAGPKCVLCEESCAGVTFGVCYCVNVACQLFRFSFPVATYEALSAKLSGAGGQVDIGIELAAKKLEQIRTDYISGHCYSEHDTGASVCDTGSAGEEYLSTLDELIEDIRILKKVPTQATPPQPLSEESAKPAGAPDTLCSDCPPLGYPTDKTRCAPCPRRDMLTNEQIEQAFKESFPKTNFSNAWLKFARAIEAASTAPKGAE